MEHKCNICVKIYKSYQSLWNHNHKFHIESVSIKSTDNKQNISNLSAENQHLNKLSCKCCKKIFKHNQSKWRHEKKCIEKTQKENEIIDYKNKIDLLETKVNKLEKMKTNKKSTNIINNINGNIVNGTNTDNSQKIIINKTGAEDMDKITYNEVSTIFDNEISSVIKLIELVNFNENKPENHSFCSTNLESPYLFFYNTDTNTVNKERKRHFFEEVICKSIQNHEILYSKYKNKFNHDKRKKIEDNIENLKKIKANSFNSNIMGEFIRKLNLISYNKRDLIQDTWNGKPNYNDSDEEFMAMLLDDPETQAIINCEKNNNLANSDTCDNSSEERPQLVFNKKNKHIII